MAKTGDHSKGKKFGQTRSTVVTPPDIPDLTQIILSKHFQEEENLV